MTAEERNQVEIALSSLVVAREAIQKLIDTDDIFKFQYFWDILESITNAQGKLIKTVE